MDGCYTESPRIRCGELSLLSEEEAADLAAAGKALGDPIRLQMVKLLEQQDNLCTCEFEELLELGQSRVSYHLKVLLRAGLVERELHGTWSHYKLRDERLLDRMRALSATATDRGEVLTA